MKKLALVFLAVASTAFATPVTLKTNDAFAMRDAITSILKGRVVVTPGAKDTAPVVALEPFDISTDALLALGHDKHALADALSELESVKSDIMAINKITGSAADTPDAIANANAQWAAKLKKTPTVTADLEPISIESLNLVKNKFSNSDVFDGLAAILKK